MSVRAWCAAIGAGCVGIASGSSATVANLRGSAQRNLTNATDPFTNANVSAQHRSLTAGLSGERSYLVELKLRVGSVPLCVDVQGGIAEPGTNIQVWECLENNVNQRFMVDENSETGQRIHWAKDTSFCLDVYDAGFAEGVNVILMKCDENNDNQIFGIDHQYGSQIHPFSHWDKCLDVAAQAGNYVSGSNVQIGYCENTKMQQQFDLAYLSSNWEIEIKPRVGSVPLCVDVQGGLQQAGTNIQVWQCSSDNQQFTVDVDMTGISGYAQRIRWAKDQSFCLDVFSAGFEDGTNVILMKCDENNSNQLFSFAWLFADTGFGEAAQGQIRTVGDGETDKCLQVASLGGSHYGDGSNLQIGSCADADKNQKFDIGFLSVLYPL